MLIKKESVLILKEKTLHHWFIYLPATTKNLL